MKRILGAVVGAVVLGAAPVQAQQLLCGSSSAQGLPVCVLANFTLTGTNTLNMFVFNGATGASSAIESSITGLTVSLPDGFGGQFGGGLTDFSVSFFDETGLASTITDRWNFNDEGSGIGTLDVDAGAVSEGNDGIATCAGPASAGVNTRWETCDRPNGVTPFTLGWDYVVFSWTFDAVIDPDFLADIGWGFRGQSVLAEGSTLEGDSIKCLTDDTFVIRGAEPVCTVDFYDPGTEIVVPEPATMTLLATGLVGLAASRRRKKNAV